MVLVDTHLEGKVAQFKLCNSLSCIFPSSCIELTHLITSPNGKSQYKMAMQLLLTTTHWYTRTDLALLTIDLYDLVLISSLHLGACGLDK